jgi:hypothetical protein
MAAVTSVRFRCSSTGLTRPARQTGSARLDRPGPAGLTDPVRFEIELT